MDLDLDLTDDKIKQFLENKLSELRSRNSNLRTKLVDRQNLVKSSFENTEGGLQIIDVWKKIIRNKFVIGIKIENTGHRGKTNFKVILDSIFNISYTWAIFEESIDDHFKCIHKTCRQITDNIKHSANVRKFGIIVVGFELPQFINDLSYSIDGNIVCNDEKENGERRHASLIIPTIKISTEDLNNRALFFNPLQNDVKDLIGLMTVYDKYEFVMILSPEWTTSLETTLEIYCSLQKFNNVESGCRLYFIATDISPLFDGIVIEVHKSQTCITTGISNSFDVKLFSRDSDAVNNLLHHLYKCIKGVLLLTPEIYQNYSIMESLKTDEDNKERLKEFNECIKKEMKFVHDFLLMLNTKCDVELKDVIEFRRKLVNFEFQSDLAYMKVI